MPTYVLCQQASYLTCLSRTGPCALKPLTHHHETAGTYTQSSKLNSALGLYGLTSTLPSCGIGRDQDSHAYCAHFYSPGKTLTGTFLTSELCKMCNYKIHDGLCRHLHSHCSSPSVVSAVSISEAESIASEMGGITVNQLRVMTVS